MRACGADYMTKLCPGMTKTAGPGCRMVRIVLFTAE
jgi:hypothetical protein